MGANAQIAVPSFTAGQVLTAAQQTEINTGIPVFATTVTRDAAFGGAGEKVLAQGQYAYIEATSTLQVYNGSAWINAISNGLTLISSTTIGSAVASVTVSSAFSATYDNYKIVLSGGVASASSIIGLKLGATTTGYYTAYNRVIFSTGAASVFSDNNTGQFNRVGLPSANGLQGNIEIWAPFLSKITYVSGPYVEPTVATGGAGTFSGLQNSTTSFTAFTLTPDTGTLTGGTINVYGYANS
jgi:hypothetical protein